MKLTIDEIIFIVEATTAVSLADIQSPKTTAQRFARYVVICMAHEEGYGIQEIGEKVKCEKRAIYYNLITISDLLTTNKPFKSMYLACAGVRAEKENAA